MLHLRPRVQILARAVQFSNILPLFCHTLPDLMAWFFLSKLGFVVYFAFPDFCLPRTYTTGSFWPLTPTLTLRFLSLPHRVHYLWRKRWSLSNDLFHFCSSIHHRHFSGTICNNGLSNYIVSYEGAVKNAIFYRFRFGTSGFSGRSVRYTWTPLPLTVILASRLYPPMHLL